MSKNHKIVSCAGFGGTGSSAITDLLSEFEGFKGIGTFEFSLIHEVDGILDLKHFLIDDFHRLKSTEAIYRFEKLINNVESIYKPYLGDDFRTESYKYIDSIIDFKWKGFWHQHLYRDSKLKSKLKYKIPRKIQKEIQKLFNKNSKYEYSQYYIKSDISYCIDKEKFLEETKKYINLLVNKLDRGNGYEYLVLDQLVAPYNIHNYSQFFDDLHVIIVDRDPRDLYLLNKLYWKEGWIPSHDVELFVKWFKSIRENKRDNSENVKYIKLEDLIFDYEKTVKEITEFLGIDPSQHKDKLKYFNPNRSLKNCRLWENEKAYREDIKYIYNNLLSYCIDK